MFSKRHVKKVIIVSTAIKMIVTVVGLIFIQATGIALPNPLQTVESRIAMAFHAEQDAQPTHMSVIGVGKVGRSPHHYHVM